MAEQIFYCKKENKDDINEKWIDQTRFVRTKLISKQ